MINSYLEKTRDDLLIEKKQVLSRIYDCENNIKENTKFISVLEESSDPNYEAFTPRNVSGFHRQKIEELKKSQKECNAQLNSLHDELDEIDKRIEEISKMIKALKENYISKSSYSSIASELSSLVQKGELCTQLVDVDSARCKQELLSLQNGLKELLNRFARSNEPCADEQN